MADNRVLIELIGRSDFQKPINDINKLRLSIEQLQHAAALLAKGTFGPSLIFSSRGLENSARGVRRLKLEMDGLYMTLARVHRLHMQGANFQLMGPSTTGGPGRITGQGAFSGYSGGGNARNSLVPAGNRYGVPMSNMMPPPGNAGTFRYAGMGGGGSGGGGGGDRFNFGQIFSGFLALGGARGINSFIADSVNKFSELEFTLKRVQIVLQPTKAGMGELKDAILDLSKALPFSIQDLSKASITIAQAGVKNLDELKSTLLTTSIVALRFGDDLQKTALDLITTANEFGIPLANLSKIASTLSVVSGDTVADIRQLGQALGQVGPGAKAIGVSLEETAVSIGIARDVSIQASRAGTNLRNLFTQLEKISEGLGTGRQERVLQKFGLSLQDVNIKSQGYTTVLRNLSQVHLSLADAQELVQQRNGVLLLALIESARGATFATSKFGQLLERTKQGADLFKDLAEQLGTTQANQILIANAFDRLKISLGETFGTFLTIVRPALIGLIDALTAIPAPISAMLLVLASVALTITGLSLLIPVVAAAVGGVFVGAWKALKFILVETLPWLVRTSVQMLPMTLVVVAAAFAIEELTASLRAGNSIWQIFGKVIVDYALAPLKGLLSIIKIFVGPEIKSQIETAVALIDNLPKALLNLNDPSTGGVVTDLKHKFEELIALITDSDLANRFKSWIKELENFNEEAAKTTAIFKANFQQLTIQSQVDFQQMVDGLAETWTDAIFGLVKGTQTFADVWQQILDHSLRSFINGFVKGMLNSFNEGLGMMLANYMMFSHNTGMGAGGGWMQALGLAGKAASLASPIPVDMLGGASMAGRAGPQVAPIKLAGFAEGGIATRPTFGMFGEDGPEALIPLDRLGTSKSQNITVVNIVDRNFVSQAMVDDPDVVVNLINADLIRNGTTRKTIKRYTQ